MATRLRDIVRAPKCGIKLGSWKAGKVPRADFPMAKKAYNLGASTDWCVISFSALDFDCKVLVMFQASKERFQAVLGAALGDQLTILCAYEYHATEPGWHCHAVCEDVRKAASGCMRGPWTRRLPKPKAWHSRPDFGISDRQEAVRHTLDFFKIAEKGPLL